MLLSMYLWPSEPTPCILYHPPFLRTHVYMFVVWF